MGDGDDCIDCRRENASDEGKVPIHAWGDGVRPPCPGPLCSTVIAKSVGLVWYGVVVIWRRGPEMNS